MYFLGTIWKEKNQRSLKNEEQSDHAEVHILKQSLNGARYYRGEGSFHLIDFIEWIGVLAERRVFFCVLAFWPSLLLPFVIYILCIVCCFVCNVYKIILFSY